MLKCDRAKCRARELTCHRACLLAAPHLGVLACKGAALSKLLSAAVEMMLRLSRDTSPHMTSHHINCQQARVDHLWTGRSIEL